MQLDSSNLSGLSSAKSLMSPPPVQPQVAMSPTFRKFGDNEHTRKLIFDNVLAAAQQFEPVSNPRHSLSIENVNWSGPDDFSKADEKHALLSRGTLARRLVGDYVLRDAAGVEVARRNAQLAKVPYLTNRGTYIINGNDYTMAHQMRLRPGIFARRKQNQELERHVNVSKGMGHRLYMDPSTGVFRIQIGQAKLPLLPVLRAMGVNDETLRKHWGNDLTASNLQYDDPHVIGKLYQRMYRNGNDVGDAQRDAVARAFREMTLDPEVTKRTLKNEYKDAGAETLLAATGKLLRINRGEEEPDDRDALPYQTLMGPEDIFPERLRKAKDVARQLLWKASARGNLDHITSGPFTDAIKAGLLGSGLGMPLEEINPADLFDQQSRVTRMGEGGIPSLDAVPDDARSVHPSQFGFIDFLRTPESGKVGVDARLARGVVKGNDGKIYTQVRTLDGKLQYKSPQDIADATVAFPNELQSGEQYVKVLQHGKMKTVPRNKVDFEFPVMEDTFSPLGNMIPFKSMVKGQRAVMAARMITQALPIRNAEAPLVQSGMPDGSGRSFEEEYSKHMGAIRAETPARVLSVDEKGITLLDAQGKKSTVSLYENFPYNRKSVCGDTRVIIRRNGEGIWEGRIADYQQQTGDKVLSIDPTTSKSSWQLITGFTKHENDKKTYLVRTESGREVVVTQDHSLVTLGDDGRLQPIYPLDCIVGKTRLPVVRIPAVSVESPGVQDMRDLGRLAGLYLAEGHCPPSQPGLIIISVEPDDRAEEVLCLLRKLGHAPYRNGGSVTFTDHARCRWLVETFGHLSGNKFIPGCVLAMPRSFLIGLVEGYFAGDGCLWADGNSAIQLAAVSTSLRLRDGMIDVLSRLGIFATLWDAPRNYLNPNWNDGYGLRVISRHISLLTRWFFYKDREQLLRTLVKSKYRASSFELVPVPGKSARRVLYAGFDDVSAYVYKTAHQGAVSKDRLKDCRGVYGTWGQSDVLWDQIVSITAVTLNDKYVYDFSVAESEVFAVCHGLLVHNTFIHQTPVVRPGDTVQPGQLLARSNFTDSQGTTALGLNARVAYIPWGGLNFEDANVISASFAKRMASEHMYQHQHEWENSDHRGLSAFVSMFPSVYDRKTLANFDEDGVIKPGTPVRQGDPLILIGREKERNRKSLLQGGKPSYRDMSEVWDHEHDGVVTDVVKTPKGASVVVKATMPMEVGDKLSGRYGDKGVVAQIVPDDQMPTDANGQPFEVLLNPLGITSRTNPAQIVEAALGKIAALRGKPYKVPDFQNEEDLVEFALKELQNAGLPNDETITDPTNGRTVPGVFTGNRWMMKLHHTSESKAQGRGLGSYTAEMSPAKGGPEGAKRIGMLETNALLSHGATDVERDAKLVRAQANPQFWMQYMSGFKPPPPALPPTYHKFVDSLRASGINVVRDGEKMHIMALTDKDIDHMAGGRELKNVETVDWRNMEPVKGGLFDPELTGGHASNTGGGQRWSYIKLHEPMPSPVMEEPIRRLLGLTTKKFEDVLSGAEKLNGISGPKAIGRALEKLDLDSEIERARSEIKSGRKTLRDAAVRRLEYLKSTKRLGIHPSNWMLSKAPVLPPSWRPISTMGPKKLPLVSDANYLYKELWDANSALKDVAQQLDENDLGDERLATYRAFKAVTGLGDPIHPKNQERQVKGILKHVFGSSPKLGVVQRRLLSTTTDLVGRAVIAPDPDLDMDQVGLPENQAWDIYRPIVIRNLVRRGMSRHQAARAVEERSEAARQTLLKELDDGVVVINRAPTLHRYGFMAARPKLTKGNVLKISPLVVSGFGADFDGDAMQYHVPVTDAARQEAIEKMLPSRNLLSAASFGVMYMPSQEYIGGLHEAASRVDERNSPLVFSSIRDAINAYSQGRVNVDRKVKIINK